MVGPLELALVIVVTAALIFRGAISGYFWSFITIVGGVLLLALARRKVN